MIDASLPVAMFDSGVGGLTVLHECLVALPQEDYVYLGDTAMFPYGTRDPEELRARIRLITEALLRRGVKLVVIACNTATAIGEDVVREVAAGHGVEVVPVVAPQAEIAPRRSPRTAASACWRRRTRSRAGHTGVHSNDRGGAST